MIQRLPQICTPSAWQTDAMANMLPPSDEYPLNWFVIKSELNGMVLDVMHGKQEEKTRIWMYNYNGTDAQLWRFDEGGRIESKCNSLALDIEGGNTSGGAKVWMFGKNETPAQKWRFTSTGELQSELNGMVLDIVDANTNLEATLQMLPVNGNKAQKWKLEPYTGETLAGAPAAAATVDAGVAAVVEGKAPLPKEEKKEEKKEEEKKEEKKKGGFFSGFGADVMGFN